MPTAVVDPIAGNEVEASWGVSVADAIAELQADANLGRMPYAFPLSFHGAMVSNGVSDLAIVSGGNGGALATPMDVPAPLALQSCSIRQGSTANLRTGQWRLYREPEGGGATLEEVPGAAGSFSFTPSAIDDRVSPAATPGVLLQPGLYWLVIRNTSAAQTFSVRRFVSTEAMGNVAMVNTSVPGLGATIDLSTWGKNPGVFLARLNGRVFGQSSAF